MDGIFWIHIQTGVKCHCDCDGGKKKYGIYQLIHGTCTAIFQWANPKATAAAIPHTQKTDVIPKWHDGMKNIPVHFQMQTGYFLWQVCTVHTPWNVNYSIFIILFNFKKIVCVARLKWEANEQKKNEQKEAQQIKIAISTTIIQKKRRQIQIIFPHK